jgi:alpha-glucosidase
MHDITRTIPEIDVPELVRYAASKGVKIWLWAHWTIVNLMTREGVMRLEYLKWSARVTPARNVTRADFEPRTGSRW